LRLADAATLAGVARRQSEAKMSEQQGGGSPAGGKRHVGGELIIPVAGLLFTVYYFSTILESPWTAQVSAFFVGAILIALILAFLVKTASDWRSGAVDFKAGSIAEPLALMPKRLVLLGLTIGYIFVISYLGFTITTFLFMVTAMSLLSNGKRLTFIVGLSVAVAVAGWALFILAFEIRFPAGPFEWLMKSIF
jgi:Tripartite tricarboxylate transporter TctB family